MTSDAIMMMSIVCNNGRLYYLLKMETFNKYEALVKYDKIYENTDTSSVSEFLRICSSIGLKFMRLREKEQMNLGAIILISVLFGFVAIVMFVIGISALISKKPCGLLIERSLLLVFVSIGMMLALPTMIVYHGILVKKYHMLNRLQ